MEFFLFRIIKLILDVILVQNTIDPLKHSLALETVGTSDVIPLSSSTKVMVVRCS